MKNQDITVIARTDRLIVREFTIEDLDCLYEIYNSWGPLPGIYPLSSDKDEEYAKLKSYIQYMYGFYGVGYWAVCLKESGRVIGRCGVQPAEIDDQWLLELGYMIHHDYTGQGYAREALLAIVDYVREETEFTCLAALIYPENKISSWLAQNLGLVYRKKVCRDGDTLDLYMRKIADDQQEDL